MIGYPLEMPRFGQFASITMRATNVVAVSRSPFTGATQVQEWPGQGWEADIGLPQMGRRDAQRWAAWLTALRGQVGSFLLGDPNAIKAGTATSASVSAASGASTLNVSMSGSILAGDYIQIGMGASARLHKVLADRSGNGALEVWPYVRRSLNNEPIILTEPKGLFRLAQNFVEWNMLLGNISGGGSIPAVEVI